MGNELPTALTTTEPLTVAGDATLAGALTIADTTGTTTFAGVFNNTGHLEAAGAALAFAGDITSARTFTNQSGSLTLSGTGPQSVTLAPASTTLQDVIVRNVSGTGPNDVAVTFEKPLTTLGTFTMQASTSAQFATTSKNTFTNVDWHGSESSPVWLRSSEPGTTWQLEVPGEQLNVQYVDVADSDATDTNGGMVAFASTDSGNNTNWDFALAAEAWNATDWTQYDTITIDHTNVDDDLTDFPVYVDLADLSADFWATTPTSSNRVGADIRVTTDAGTPTELPRELVAASSTAETGELHFKADSISSTTDTVFRIYYNGTTTGDYAPDATYGAQAVWSNDYLAVYHDGGSTDSTSFTRNATAVGSVTEGNTSGQVGNATDLNGSDQAFISSDASRVDGLTSFTTSLWVQSDIAATDNPIYILNSTGYDDTTNDFTLLRFDDAGFLGSGDDVIKAAVRTEAGTLQNGETTSNTATTEWMHLHQTWDSAANDVFDLYQNGSAAAWSAAPGSLTGTLEADVVAIGRGNKTGWWDGIVDEFRLASTSRSAAWINAEYINQATTTDFYTTAEGSSGGVTISGTLYEADGATAITSGATVSSWRWGRAPSRRRPPPPTAAGRIALAV